MDKNNNLYDEWDDATSDKKASLVLKENGEVKILVPKVEDREKMPASSNIITILGVLLIDNDPRLVKLLEDKSRELKHIIN